MIIESSESARNSQMVNILFLVSKSEMYEVKTNSNTPCFVLSSFFSLTVLLRPYLALREFCLLLQILHISCVYGLFYRCSSRRYLHSCLNGTCAYSRYAIVSERSPTSLFVARSDPLEKRFIARAALHQGH